MKTNIWFPFYTGDYITDTMHLSTEEHGAYILLIIHYWQTQTAIKNCKKTLKNITKINSKKLQNVLAFFEEKNGYFYHKRIEEELKKASKNKALKSEAGKKGMQSRYNKAITGVITEAQQNPYQTPNPSPSPSYITKSKVGSNTLEWYSTITELVYSEPDVLEELKLGKSNTGTAATYQPDFFVGFCEEKFEKEFWQAFCRYHEKKQSRKSKEFWLKAWQEHIQRNLTKGAANV